MAKKKNDSLVCPDCLGTGIDTGTTHTCYYCLGTGFCSEDDTFENIYRYDDWR